MKKNEAATNPDEFVHARPAVYSDDGVQHEHAHGGITIREYFAALAMQGILANPSACDGIQNVIGEDAALQFATAAIAVAHADALIEALNAEDLFARFRK